MNRAQDELHDTCDKACAILKKTDDGDLLDPNDLKLTELAVNGHLNNAGREVFEKLYRRVVIDGTYIKPYLHGIEHITRDHEGYIYYKGIHVEHYDHDYVHSEDAKNSLWEMKRRCEFLEGKDIPVSCGSVIWRFEEYSDEYSAERLKEMDALLGNDTMDLEYSRIELYNSGREYTYFVCGKPEDLEAIKNHPVTQSMIGRYFDDEYEIKVETFIYGKRQAHRPLPVDKIREKAEVESLLYSCHAYLKRQDRLEILPVAAYKTDFAAGYESVKRLDSLLNSHGRSLQYSEVLMYGYDSGLKKLYLCGVPSFDDVKKHDDYQLLAEEYGDRLTVAVTTYQYGRGEPLKPEEMPPITAVTEALSETHYYMQKHDLSHEIGWKDFTHDVEVRRSMAQAESEAEDGYEL